MNLKQLIKFGIEESSVPVIKNPILRAALEPRSAVQEPRNMYAGGQLVRNTVDGSRPGYDGDSSFNRNPAGTNQYTKLTHPRTLVEIQTIIDNAPTIEIDGKFFEQNSKDLQGRSEYSGKELITRKEHEKYKDKLKYKSTGKKRIELRSKASEKRTKWTKEFSDVTTEGKLAGTKKSGLELSHLGSKTGLVTPNNLAYLPKYTNKLSYFRFEKILNGIQTDQRKILADNKMTMDAKRKALAELAKADRTLRNRFKGLGYDKIKTRIKTKAFAWGIGEKEVLKDPTIAIGKGETGANVALKKASKAEKAKIVEMGKNRLNKFLKEVASKDSKAAQRVITQLNSGIPINQIMEELARVPGMKKLARGFMKVGGPWEVGFAAVDFANNLYSMDPDEAFKTTMSDVTFGLYEGGQREAMETLNDAAAEIGHSNKGFNSYKEIMDLNKLLESEKEKLKKLNAKKGKFPDEEIDWMIKSSEKFIPRLQKEIDSKVESFIQDEDYENIIKSYDQTVNYVARKQYNKNVEDRKNLVNTDMNVIGSSAWSAITEPIKTILPQNLMETTSVTRPYVRALRKTPFVGKFFDPTSKEAKLSAMSKEEKIKRAIELNAVRQNYHPVTGNTMTYGQMEPYYDKYYAEGGIASLMKKKW